MRRLAPGLTNDSANRANNPLQLTGSNKFNPKSQYNAMRVGGVQISVTVTKVYPMSPVRAYSHCPTWQTSMGCRWASHPHNLYLVKQGNYDKL